ncbi:TPA: hypothetical protein NJ265_003517 [Vibrio parahaemolyticus]|nr:hypothetical protein [Vibrio parahaemolyticus]HCE5183779.1 hypothetical protein [Vibrio parahaemolyticus]HCG5604966.1 hypothetical protein [Vibrio parahaemolyticus]HCG6435379.1 hypothetical protein [Vibrio parahaemolyticus]HCG7266586.1 hypothetical protein [Vibrio parahaemolyticus]
MAEAAIPFIVATAVSVGISLYMASQFDTSIDDTGALINKSGTSAARNPTYGTCFANGIPVYSNVNNNSRENLLNVFACGIGVTGVRQVYIDGVEVLATDQVSRRETPDGGNDQFRLAGGALINGFQKQCELQIRAGLDTGVPMQLAIDHGDGEWTEAMRGDRVCAVAIKSRRIVDEEAVRIMSDKFKVQMLVDGLPLYDPRYNVVGEKQFVHDQIANPEIPTKHLQCGRNPALAILDYMTDSYYGMAIPLEYFDIESFKAAATWCDDNDFHIDGQLDNTQEFSKNLDDMLKCANLSLTSGGGFIQLRYEDVELPKFDFDEDNIINGTFEITEQNSSDYANVVEVEYKNTELDEQKDVFTLPEDVNNDPQILEDGFIESVTLSMPLTRYAGSARNDYESPMKKLANRELARRQYQKQIKFDVDLYETPVQIFDVVTVTDEVLGWDAKEFRVTSIGRSLTSDRFNIATVSCTEYADEIYTGTKNGSGGSAKPVKPEVSAPTNLNFSLDDYTNRGYGTLTWDRTWFETDAEYLVDYKRSSESAWTRLGRTKDTIWKVARLFPDSYDFRVATHSNLYGTSDFVQIDNFIVSSLGTLPTVTGASGKFDGLVCEFKWDDMLDAQVTGNFEDTKLVREIFSHYRVSLFDVSSGESLIDTFTTSRNAFTWTYEQNVAASLTRSLRVKIEIVAIDGSMSNVTSSAIATAVNAQCAVPTGLNNYGRLGAIWFNYDPSADSDWSGTEIHISETPNFTPSASTLAGVLGKQTSWVWYYPSGTPDNEARYVRIGHFDSFGRDNIAYSPEETVVNYHIDNDATPFDDTELQNQIAANDATLAAHETELAQHESDLTSHQATLNQHTSDLAAHDTRMDGHDTTLSQHNVRMNLHDSTLAAHDTRMDGHDTTLANHNTRMNNLQSDLDAAEQAFSEQIPNVSDELSQLRNAANAPTLPNGTPIDTRINMVASPDKTETAAWGLFADNTGKSQFIVAADEFIVSGGKASGNAANDDVAFYYSNDQLLINNATIKNLTASSIAAGTITATQIAGSTITGSKIAANTLTASHIAANAITASELAAGSVSASHIVSGTITATQLAANSVTATQLAANSVSSGHIVAGTIVASNIATGTITGTQIAGSTITGSKIAAGTIVASNIATGTITATQLAANSVTASEIASSAVTTNKLAAGAVTAATISSNAIETNHLSAGAVTAAKISAGNINAGHIAADAINGSHVSASSDIVVGTGDDVVRLNGSDATWRIAAGNAAMASSPFRVDKDGKMYATNAVVTGSVTASSGRINGSLYVGTGNDATDYAVWYGGKHPNTNGESFRLFSDGKYRYRQWYNGRTIWYKNDGSSYFLDVNPAANTASFYGTVQAENIVGDIASMREYAYNYRNTTADVNANTWLDIVTVNIDSARPYARKLMIEPVSSGSIFVNMYVAYSGWYNCTYRLVGPTGTVHATYTSKYQISSGTPLYNINPSVGRVFAEIAANAPAGAYRLQFSCDRDAEYIFVDYSEAWAERRNQVLLVNLFKDSGELS